MAAIATMNRTNWVDSNRNDNDDSDDDDMDLLLQPMQSVKRSRKPKLSTEDVLEGLFSESTQQHSSMIRLQQSFASSLTPTDANSGSRDVSSTLHDDSDLKNTIEQLTQSLVAAKSTPSAMSPQEQQEQLLLKRASEDDACIPYGIVNVPSMIPSIALNENDDARIFRSTSDALEYLQKFVVPENEWKENTLKLDSDDFLTRIHRFYTKAVVSAMGMGTLLSLKEPWLALLRDGTNAMLDLTEEPNIDWLPRVYQLHRQFYQWLIFVACSANLREEKAPSRSKKRSRRMPPLHTFRSDATHLILAVQAFYRQYPPIPLLDETMTVVTSISLAAFSDLLLHLWFPDESATQTSSTSQVDNSAVMQAEVSEQTKNILGFQNFLLIHERILGETDDDSELNDAVQRSLQVLIRCTIQKDMQRIKTTVQHFTQRFLDRMLKPSNPISQEVLNHMKHGAVIALEGILEIEGNSASPAWLSVSTAARSAVSFAVDGGYYPNHWRAAFAVRGMEIILFEKNEMNETLLSYVRTILKDDSGEWTALFSESSLCWLSLSGALVVLRQWNQLRYGHADPENPAKLLAMLECAILLFQSGLLLLKDDDTAAKMHVDPPNPQHPCPATEFGSFINAKWFLSYLTEFDDLCVQGSKRGSMMMHPLSLRADMLLKYIHLDNLKMKQRLQYIVGDDEAVLSQKRQTKISNFFARDPEED